MTMMQSSCLTGVCLLQIFVISLVRCGVVPTSDGPDTCFDKLGFEACRHYDQAKCDYEVYRPWAMENCKRYCGYCTVPTSPEPCFDRIKHCNVYSSDLCTNPLYHLYVHDNCRMFCSRCIPQNANSGSTVVQQKPNSGSTVEQQKPNSGSTIDPRLVG